MSDLIDRQALLKQIDIDSDGEPGYYGDTWKFIDTIKSMPPATQLSTNLAEVGTDCISRQAAIDALAELQGRASTKAELKGISKAWKRIKQLPSAQPEIIRCKDCKTWQNDYAPNYHYCPMIDGTHRNDFYCADAERRETNAKLD